MTYEVVYQFSELWVPPRATPVYLPALVLLGMLAVASLLWQGHRNNWFEPSHSIRDFFGGFLMQILYCLAWGLVITGGMVLLESRPSLAQADLLDKVRQGKVEQIEGYIWLRPELRDADDRIVQQHTLLIGRSRFPYKQGSPSFDYFLKQAGVLQNGQYARITHVKGNVVKVEIQR